MWVGVRDIETTMIYADYQASDPERELVGGREPWAEQPAPA